VALDRVTVPSSLPNLLIQKVSAVEGFSRSMALEAERRVGKRVEDAYAPLRYLNGVVLIRDHIAPRFRTDPEHLFDPDDWDLFALAVEYRNFLVHEASSLRAGYCDAMGAACERVLRKLAEVSGVSP